MPSRGPNRSDVHASLEEEVRIEGETREYFDGIAPKRHIKPQRSDYSSHYTDDNSDPEAAIPEFTKFQHLENNDSQKLVYNRNKATEEYVETEYYKDLNCIDKQHHTTGTGFISVENVKDDRFTLVPDPTPEFHFSSKGNPATNDWIPAASEMITSFSDKPNRSDS